MDDRRWVQVVHGVPHCFLLKECREMASIVNAWSWNFTSMTVVHEGPQSVDILRVGRTRLRATITEVYRSGSPRRGPVGGVLLGLDPLSGRS